MSYSTTVGVDLAKNVIQISVVSGRGKELSNRSLSRRKFAEFLGKQQRSLVAFEACATAHYWARTAQRYGHEVRIIPAKAVAPFRQGHKTDSNDALAVAEAAGRPNIKEAPMKDPALPGSVGAREHGTIEPSAWLADGVWCSDAEGLRCTATNVTRSSRGR
jgi:transposase